MNEVIARALRTLIDELPVEALGLRSHALPTETALGACVEAIAAVISDLPGRRCRAIVGSSALGPADKRPGVTVLEPDAAAAEATRLRNDPWARESGALLLYFNSDSTPGEAGLSDLVELTAAQLACAYARRADLPLLARVAESRARRVVMRLEDAGAALLGEYADLAHAHSEAFALPLLRLVCSGRRQTAAMTAGLAGHFDRLTGQRAANRLAEAEEAMKIMSPDERARLGRALESYLPAGWTLGGASPFDFILTLCGHAAALAMAKTDDPAGLCGMTIELSRELRAGATRLRALAADNDADADPRPDDEEEDEGDEDDGAERHWTERDVAEREPTSLEGQIAVDRTDTALREILLVDASDDEVIALKPSRNAALLKRILEALKDPGRLARGCGVRIGDERAILTREVPSGTTVEAFSELSPEALAQAQPPLRAAINSFLVARATLLKEAGAVAQPPVAADEDAPDVGEAGAPATLYALLILEQFPLLAAARLKSSTAAYLAAFNELVTAAASGDGAAPQRVWEWLLNLDVAFCTQGHKVTAARLLPCHPLRLAHSRQWLASRLEPPPLPGLLAVHYKGTEDLGPTGAEFTYAQSTGLAPSPAGIRLAAEQGLDVAWRLLSPRGLTSALEIELVDVADPETIIDALCERASVLFDEDVRAGMGVHLNVRLARTTGAELKARAAVQEELSEAALECLQATPGDGVSLSLSQVVAEQDSTPCHLAIEVVEAPFVRLAVDNDTAVPFTLSYEPGPNGNIALVEVEGDETVAAYRELLEREGVRARRLGLDPSHVRPTVRGAIVKALVARRGWPITPDVEAGVLTYERRADHVVVVLAHPDVTSRQIERRLRALSPALEASDIKLLRAGVLALSGCRRFFDALLNDESDRRHLLGMLGLLRAFNAARQSKECALVLSLDGPEGRGWANAYADDEAGTRTRADLLIIESPDLKSVGRLRVAELKARTRNRALTGTAQLTGLARQAQIAAARVRACFVEVEGQEASARREALRALVWMGAGHQLQALAWREVLRDLDSRFDAAASPLPVTAECWIVPEEAWDGERDFVLRLPCLSASGEAGTEEEDVRFRVLTPVEPSAVPMDPADFGDRSAPTGVAPSSSHVTESKLAPDRTRQTHGSQASEARPLSAPAPTDPSDPVPPGKEASPIALKAASAPPEETRAVRSPDTRAATPFVVTPSHETNSSGPVEGMRVVLGRLDGGDEAFWLPNRTDLVNHYNVGITGTMGTGKTQLTKSLIGQLLWDAAGNVDRRRPGLLIFDYKGDYQDSQLEKFASEVGARVHLPEGLPLNPLHISQPRTRQELMLMPHGFAETLQAISPQIGSVQRGELVAAVKACYEQAGIYAQDKASWTRPFPTLTELANYIDTNGVAQGTPQTLIRALDDLGVFAGTDQATGLDTFFDGVNVIDLRPLASTPAVIRSILCFFMNAFYDRMMQLGEAPLERRVGDDGQPVDVRQLRRIVLVDEADDFIGLSLNSLKNVMQQGRSFGCGVILSTQFLHHFNKGDQPLRPLVGTWVLHQMSEVSTSDVKSLFGYDKRDEASAVAARLGGLQKHTSLVFGLSNRGRRTKLTAMQDLPYWRLEKPKRAR